MKKVYGISASCSSFERGLWWDHDERDYKPQGWGIKFDVLFGKMIRPIPLFWTKKYWQDMKSGSQDSNPWKGGSYWKILRIPFMPAFFVSIALGKYGFYFGCKTFKIEPHHCVPERYGPWVFTEEVGGTFLQLSATTRTTRWK
jgi:hypothetical protein